MKTIIEISAKCSDMFDASLTRLEGNVSYSGYVPSWFPNPNAEHYGDYVRLQIDVDTGQILNWKKPSAKQLRETFKS